MTSRPIPFSAPMVRALLDGSKTQTRRVCNPQPIRVDGGVPSRALPPSLIGIADPVYGIAYNCPYGKQRDQLWVREAFYEEFGHPPVDQDERTEWINSGYLAYRATDDKAYGTGGYLPWKPSIHMPRWASRITLEITGVRVELLQDISQVDAMNEGALPTSIAEARELDMLTYEAGYRKLWESINGAGSWDLNPWVWVIEFKKVKP